jgi:glycosyltransferase involved in cell wall biosynthesis
MLISVVLTAFNTERYLAEAIESVLNQKYQDLELIMIDDGSTDRTLEIMRQYEASDDRVRVIAQENAGAGAARNAGIAIAQGEWIAIVDADDVMEPNRLERQIAFLQEHPDLDVATSPVTFINHEGHEFGRSQPVLLTHEEVRELCEQGLVVGVPNPASIIRKSTLLGVGGYRGEFWPSEDLDLWTRIVESGGTILTQPEYLTRYRVHPGSGSYGKIRKTAELMGWLRHCSMSRRAGTREPSREEYIALQGKLPLLRRINDRRKNLAFALYRQSTLDYSTGSYFAMALWLIAAAACGSTDVLRQIRGRLIGPAIRQVKLAGRRGL